MSDDERPGPNASAAEIAEWMENDFSRALVDGVTDADTDSDCTSDVVEVQIINIQSGEVVGTINTDGELKTESGALREVAEPYVESGVPVLAPTPVEQDGEGTPPPGEVEVLVEPGTPGFVRAFVDELPSPFDCPPDELDSLPVYSP